MHSHVAGRQPARAMPSAGQVMSGLGRSVPRCPPVRRCFARGLLPSTSWRRDIPPRAICRGPPTGNARNRRDRVFRRTNHPAGGTLDSGPAGVRWSWGRSASGSGSGHQQTSNASSGFTTRHGCAGKRLSDGAPARTRTWDQLIKSQLLYQLSYRGDQIFQQTMPASLFVAPAVVSFAPLKANSADQRATFAESAKAK